MKKVLLSLLAVAALVLSCQNYDDEFDALNSKIASLESQITSLAELRTAVTGVQSSISALQSAVASAQAAAEAADNSDAITALATSVAAIAADLVELQTAIAGATTEADLTALRTQLESTLESLRELIESNSDQITSLVTSNADLKSQLEALGVDVDAVLAANSTFDGDLKITNEGELLFAKSQGNNVKAIRGNVEVLVEEDGLDPVEVNKVLSLIEFVVGDVKITSDSSLDLSALTTVSGDYTIIGHDVNDSALANVGDDMWLNYDGEISYTSLLTADHIFIVGKAADEDAEPTALVGTTKINLLSLTKASGVSVLNSTHTSGGGHTSGSSLSVTGLPLNSLFLPEETTEVKIGQAPVVLVQGDELTTLELHYAADYDEDDNEDGSDALASLAVTAPELTSATVMAKTITGNVTIAITASDATAATGTASFPELTSAGGMISDALTTSFASIETIGTGGIDLEFDETVSLPELAVSGGAIVLDEATSFSAPELTRVGSSLATAAGSAITANEVTGSVEFGNLTKAGAVTMQKVTSFSAKNAKVSKIDIEEGTATTDVTVILGSVSSTASPPSSSPLSTYVPDASAITVLELHNQDATIDLTEFTLATDITLNGKANAAGVAVVDVDIDSDNSKLVNLTLGGKLNEVDINTNAAVATAAGVNANTALASVVTSGTIVDIEVMNNFDLKKLDLGHTDDAKSATAARISVKGNNNLEDFSVAVKKISELTITGNKKLKSFDVSSISELPNNWSATLYSVIIDIKQNDTDPSSERTTTYKASTNVAAGATQDALSNWYGLTGTFSDETSSSDRVYGQSSLAGLKPFLALLASTYELDDAVITNDVAFKSGTSITMEYRYDTTSAGTTVRSTGDISLTGLTASDFAKYADLQ
jgi:hypothetical protein